MAHLIRSRQWALFIGELVTLAFAIAGVLYLWPIREDISRRYPDMIVPVAWTGRAVTILAATYGLATLLLFLHSLLLQCFQFIQRPRPIGA